MKTAYSPTHFTRYALMPDTVIRGVENAFALKVLLVQLAKEVFAQDIALGTARV